METCWVSLNHFTNFVTGVLLAGSLTTSLRVGLDRSSSSVEFWPIALATVCSHAWLIYGSAIGDSAMILIEAASFLMMSINAVVHRWFSQDTGPGLALLVTVGVMCTALSTMPVACLGGMASALAVCCGLAPIVRMLREMPLPEMSLWTVAASGSWLGKAMAAEDAPLIACTIVGIAVASLELIMYFWMQCSSRVRSHELAVSFVTVVPENVPAKSAQKSV